MTIDVQASESGRREQIARELARLEESSKFSAANQFEMAQQWNAVHLALGIPASVLAAVAGVTALAATTGAFVAGVIALAAAALGAMLTVLNASRKAAQASSVANAYLAIQTAARQERLIDTASRPIEEARDQLAELTTRRDEQNHSAAPPNRLARRRAKKNLDAGSQTYEVDREAQA